MSNLLIPIVNRSELNTLKPIINYLTDKIDYKIVLSSSITKSEYSNSIDDIKIDHIINTFVNGDHYSSICKNFGLSMIEYSTFIENNNFDYVLLMGDRFDMFPMAVCAFYNNIPIIHLQGGELSGTIDNKIRYMTSLISKHNFVATKKCIDNLNFHGIYENIYHFGCPAVDYITRMNIKYPLNRNLINSKLSRDIDFNKDYILFLVHPDSTNDKDFNVECVFKKLLNYNCIVITPNIDKNNSNITNIIDKFRNYNNFYITDNLTTFEYINLLANASLLIGNSSSFIRESASFGVPHLLLGNRQLNRETNINTIMSSVESIDKDIQKYFNYKFEKINLYYKPNAIENIGKKIINIVKE